MLRKAQSLIGIKLHALDGDIGHVEDFYFDDLKWTVRYMIVRTGSWFAEKHVMLSPSAVRDIVWDEHVYVDLTQEQIQTSPDLDLEKPVTREQELELARYYQWPTYWVGSPASAIDSPSATMGLAATGVPAIGVAAGVVPSVTSSSPRMSDHIANDIFSTGVSEEGLVSREVANSPERKTEVELQRAAQAEGLHHYLRGVKEVTGYHIAASDGEIGHVEDFFIEEENWRIEYLLVDTKNWLPGRKVLISPDWIDEIVWEDKKVRVRARREQVKSSPEYNPHGALERSYEGRLHEHYGYPPYWA